MITELKPNQIFVFGSNLRGDHLGGAAKQAYEQFGAIWGVGSGLQGQSYAIPTMEGLESLVLYVEQFKRVALLLPQYVFLLTPVGTGIAGYSPKLIAPLFKDSPENVILPEEFKL